jgi:hypothetical protein
MDEIRIEMRRPRRGHRGRRGRNVEMQVPRKAVVKQVYDTRRNLIFTGTEREWQRWVQTRSPEEDPYLITSF